MGENFYFAQLIFSIQNKLICRLQLQNEKIIKQELFSNLRPQIQNIFSKFVIILIGSNRIV